MKMVADINMSPAVLEIYNQEMRRVRAICYKATDGGRYNNDQRWAREFRYHPKSNHRKYLFQPIASDE